MPELLPRSGTALLLEEKRILEMVATSVPAAETLAALSGVIEAQEAGLRCGVLLVSEDGECLRQGGGAVDKMMATSPEWGRGRHR